MEVTESIVDECYITQEESIEESCPIVKIIGLIQFPELSDNVYSYAVEIKRNKIKFLNNENDSTKFIPTNALIHAAEVAKEIFEIYHETHTHQKGLEAERKIRNNENINQEELRAYIQKNYPMQRA